MTFCDQSGCSVFFRQRLPVGAVGAATGRIQASGTATALIFWGSEYSSGNLRRFLSLEMPMTSQRAQRIRILLVDDQPSMTGMWKIFLEHQGYLVEEENRAEFALLTARRFAPDVMVLDMQMPVMDGREVATRIKADPQLHKTAVVFLTSVVTEREVAAGKRIEGFPCLPKPADCKALLRIIEKSLAPADPAPAKPATVLKISDFPRLRRSPGIVPKVTGQPASRTDAPAEAKRGDHGNRS